MSQKKAHSPAPSSKLTQPRIDEASLGSSGSVIKLRAITESQAEALRANGQDVVVCGPDLAANRSLAQTIERNANGRYKRCGPIPTRARMPYPISNLILGRQKVILLMKPRIEERSEGRMKFFKPSLYLRYNSPDDTVAVRWTPLSIEP
jgi:hypothetical protein